MKPSPILTVFEYNAYSFRTNLEGVNHQTSINQMPSYANTINWVAGHIVLSRDKIMALLGQDSLCSDAYQVYLRGSAILDTDKAVNLEEIQEVFEQGQLVIEAAFKSLDPRRDEQSKIIKKLAGFSFHEAYHVGQLGYGRRLVGKKGALQ